MVSCYLILSAWIKLRCGTQDCTRLVKRSCELGMPLVAVTFNYRVGVLGFLHSKELAEDALLQSEVPPQFRSTGNLGLVDSYYAFQWVLTSFCRTLHWLLY